LEAKLAETESRHASVVAENAHLLFHARDCATPESEDKNTSQWRTAPSYEQCLQELEQRTLEVYQRDAELRQMRLNIEESRKTLASLKRENSDLKIGAAKRMPRAIGAVSLAESRDRTQSLATAQKWHDDQFDA
jgi:hypothetical protein